MKRCPKCSLIYSDDTLDFCLEDGTRLASGGQSETEVPTVTLPNKPDAATAKTVDLFFSNPPAKSFESSVADSAPTILQTNPLKDKVAQKSNKILEIAPLVIALAHNWWQWIYLNNQNYSSFSNYILSANFLMWLLLLTLGTAAGLLAVKRCQNRVFAYTSLVILSINLILFLVPKR